MTTMIDGPTNIDAPTKDTPLIVTNSHAGDAIYGQASSDPAGQSGRGVVGVSQTGSGVEGDSVSGAGVWGESEKFDGVFGVAKDASRAGVSGHNLARGLGGFFDGHVVVTGHQANFPSLSGNNDAGGDGVTGTAINNGRGVVGIAKANAGVVGDSQSFDGVFGLAHDKNRAGVSGHNTNAGGLAGFFEGNVVVTGDVTGGGTGLKQLSDAIQQLRGTIQQQGGSIQQIQQLKNQVDTQGATILTLESQIAGLATRLSALGG